MLLWLLLLWLCLWFVSHHYIPKVLGDLKTHSLFCQKWGMLLVFTFDSELSPQNLAKDQGARDVGDHPPIVPLRTPEPGEVSGQQKRLYDYVCQHFVALLDPNLEMLQISRSISVPLPLKIGEWESCSCWIYQAHWRLFFGGIGF